MDLDHITIWQIILVAAVFGAVSGFCNGFLKGAGYDLGRRWRGRGAR